MTTPVSGILFDKDGVLFDFQKTWGAWAARMIARFAGADAALSARLAQALDFDLATGLVRPGSFMIAGTSQAVADAFAATLPGWPRAEVDAILADGTATTPLVPAVALRPTFVGLRARGIAIGLATNDSERAALAHLGAAGVLDLFDFVAGADSGHGAKPAPGMCTAFAAHVGMAPDALVMVGDSTHDMHAGRAAGFTCVAVLTGVAVAADLAPHADAVLPDIAALEGWLDGRAAG